MNKILAVSAMVLTFAVASQAMHRDLAAVFRDRQFLPRRLPKR